MSCLWPGTLVSVRVTLRTRCHRGAERLPFQVSQQGNFVYVVKGQRRHRHAIKVARLLGEETVIESGLSGPAMSW